MGADLANGKRDPDTVRIAEALLEISFEHGVDMPLLQALVDIVGGADPLDVVGNLMTRTAQPEMR
jgi:glycerol-3-phosphate dehydrogenase